MKKILMVFVIIVFTLEGMAQTTETTVPGSVQITLKKIWKKVFLAAALIVLSISVFAQWAVDKGHSKITFIASHHDISEVDGYFKKYDVSLTATKNDLSDVAF